jgi:hypothetical protein
VKALSPHFGCGISSKIAVEEMDLQNCQAQLQNILDVATTPLPSSCNIAHDNMELCIQEVCVQQVLQLFHSEIVKNVNLKDNTSDYPSACLENWMISVLSKWKFGS